MPVTFGRYQPAANEVDLVPHEDDGPRGHVIATPQGLEDLLGHPHRRPIGRGVDDAVSVRLVRRDAILRLQADLKSGAIKALTRPEPDGRRVSRSAFTIYEGELVNRLFRPRPRAHGTHRPISGPVNRPRATTSSEIRSITLDRESRCSRSRYVVFLAKREDIFTI